MIHDLPVVQSVESHPVVKVAQGRVPELMIGWMAWTAWLECSGWLAQPGQAPPLLISELVELVEMILSGTEVSDMQIYQFPSFSSLSAGEYMCTSS